MSELVVLGLKLGFLALLWLFILFTGNVIRTDRSTQVTAAGSRRCAIRTASATTPRMSRKAVSNFPDSDRDPRHQGPCAAGEGT